MKRKISIKEIAKMAGVSPTTVQNVLKGRKERMREDTYKKVMDIINEREYVQRVAPKLLNEKNAGIVGVVVSENCINSGENEKYTNSIFLLECENYKNNCYTILHVSSKVEEIVEFFKAWPTTSIYVWGFDEKEREDIKNKTGIPVNTLM